MESQTKRRQCVLCFSHGYEPCTLPEGEDEPKLREFLSEAMLKHGTAILSGLVFRTDYLIGFYFRDEPDPRQQFNQRAYSEEILKIQRQMAESLQREIGKDEPWRESLGEP